MPEVNIRIKSRPSGGAPDEVRDAWVGLIMRATTNDSLLADVITLAKVERTGGYAVEWNDAMAALSGHPKAKEWWEKRAGMFSALVFSEDCCELL